MKKPSKATLSAVSRAVKTAHAENRPLRLLFVCLGNICRSPAAEGMMREIASEKGVELEIDSCGFYGGHAGDLPDRRMRIAARQRGLDLTHRSRKIRPTDFFYFDLIFGMDSQNIRDLHRAAPTLEEDARIIPMADLAVRHPEVDAVPDPYYDGAEGFYNVLEILDDACSFLMSLIISDQTE